MIYNSFDNIGFIKVLKFLKSHPNEFLSGQDLSDVLKISRVAVWKHIKKIKELGYEIDSKQKFGYKLVKDTGLMLPWEITEGLKTKFVGKRTYYFDTLDSTQQFASSIASKKNQHGTVIISQKQTKGKGRLGRKWHSPIGGIWMSIILQPKFDVDFTTLVPIGASLALAKAIEKTLNLKPELKWPNDVTLERKKVAGILVEMTLESNKIQNMTVGVGINFKIDVKKVAEILKNTENFYGIATLVKRNQNKNPVKFIQSYLLELENVLDKLVEGKTRDIIRNWSQRSSTIGQKITISTKDGKISGKASRLDSDGALVLSVKGKNIRILVGDVIHISGK